MRWQYRIDDEMTSFVYGELEVRFIASKARKSRGSSDQQILAYRPRARAKFLYLPN